MVRLRVADVRGREAGFSLSELIVVIAMIGVLAALGLPQFMSYWQTSATTAAASELATAINRARQLAISGNQNYCAEVSGSSVRYRQNANATCSAGTIWTGTGTDGSGLINLSNNIGVSGGPVVFTSLGAAALAGTFTVTNPNGGSRHRVVARPGRANAPNVPPPAAPPPPPRARARLPGHATLVQGGPGPGELSSCDGRGRSQSAARGGRLHRARTENMTTALRRRSPTLRDERGIALIVAVLALFCLTGLLAAYLSVATLEPQISRNLADVSRARHLAEAGIERGFNVLVSTADGSQSWSGLLVGATTGRPWVALAGLTNVALRGATNGGTFSVAIRNDNGMTDTPLTGLSGTTNPPMDTSPTTDANKTVIMRSAATLNGTTKTIETVAQPVPLPPSPRPLTLPAPHP